MPQIVTADQFITGVLCALAERGERRIKLVATLADQRFERAYDDLVSQSAALSVEPDFSLTTNPYHGDSETLRETLYAARDRGIVAINNPSFKTVEITIDSADVESHFARSSLPKTFFEELVDRHFGEANGEPGRTRQLEGAA